MSVVQDITVRVVPKKLSLGMALQAMNVRRVMFVQAVHLFQIQLQMVLELVLATSAPQALSVAMAV